MGNRETSTTGSATATLAAPAENGNWRGRLRVSIYALYRRLEERPVLPVEEETERLVALIDEGRAEPASPSTLSRVTAEGLGGAISYELLLAACQGPPPPESELVPMLMYSAVLPYVGVGCATEELRTPPPPR